jgi:hypothetical protein
LRARISGMVFPISLGVKGRELILSDRSQVSKRVEQYWVEKQGGRFLDYF